ncbi:MAG: nucleotidyltransferase family protein [Marinoscillum sp.]
MNSFNHIGVIILAAGGSSRLGRPKQLVKFEGKSLLQRIINEANQIQFGFRLVVLGWNQDSISSSLDLNGFEKLINENWQGGIGTSIKAGTTHALKMAPGLKHLLFLLSDQPLVTGTIIRLLCDSHLENRVGVTACRYGGNIGVPAIFPKGYFSSLTSLNGDQGAKKIILNNQKDTQFIEFPDGAFDIDTPEDLKKLLSLNKTLK